MRLLICLTVTTTVIAQAASLSGRVGDGDGRPVNNAPVYLRRVTDGKTFNAVTSRDGHYVFSTLPAGSFDLYVPQIGFTFKRYEKKGIVLTASQREVADLRLEWGNLGTVGDDDSTILHMGRPPAPRGPAPHMPDGKPDLSGVWNGQNDANPEPALAMPWAEEIAKKRVARDNPSARCLPGDVLLNSPNPFEIIQTPGRILIVAEYNVGANREIFLDGRGHPREMNPSWMGHSIGRWEKDTLVVDTVGFNDRSWLDDWPHTEALHVVTRYRRVDLGHLDIQITVEDPNTFVKPWHLHHVWELMPGEELQEFVCENNFDLQHMPAK